jgi:hypothetical protein
LLDLSQAVVVDFPLKGEWTAVNTPAHRVPSHGTDYFGQRYAFDFIQLHWETQRPCVAPVWRHLFGALPARAFFCWDQPVYSAFDGRVLVAGDGWRDRARINGLWELLRASLLAPVGLLVHGPRSPDYRPLTGNFLLIEGDVGVALYAHLRQGTVRVASGDQVRAGTELGRIGNSGNSTMPHLHFHLMDGADPYTAAGRLCAFRSYDRYRDGRWERTSAGVPARLERVRAV